VAFSFDPRTPSRSRRPRRRCTCALRPRNTANGCTSSPGTKPNIKALMDAVGFHYKYDPATDQYAHASGRHDPHPEKGASLSIFLRVE